eukprot:jgi/Mesvir1/25691/Mv01890-RA.1
MQQGGSQPLWIRPPRHSLPMSLPWRASSMDDNLRVRHLQSIVEGPGVSKSSGFVISPSVRDAVLSLHPELTDDERLETFLCSLAAEAELESEMRLGEAYSSSEAEEDAAHVDWTDISSDDDLDSQISSDGPEPTLFSSSAPSRFHGAGLGLSYKAPAGWPPRSSRSMLGHREMLAAAVSTPREGERAASEAIPGPSAVASPPQGSSHMPIERRGSRLRLHGSQPRLILHMDINKTIIMRDNVQNTDLDSMVNVLLSDCAWGRLHKGPTWEAVGRLANDRPLSDPELMTYRSFLDSFLLPLMQGYGKEVDTINEEIKQKRQVLKRSFTCRGQPGEMFSGVHDRLLRALEMSQHVHVPPDIAGKAGHMEQVSILPSFLRLLRHLHSRGRRFSVVFRTFGTDILEVAEEMNLFCVGKHPLAPSVRMDGVECGSHRGSHTSGETITTDLRIYPDENVGVFLRDGFGPDGTTLAIPCGTNLLGAGAVSRQLLDEEAPVECEQRTTFREIYNEIIARCCAHGNTRNTTLALRDYYKFWKAHQERAKAGKLLLIDPSDEEIHQIFFDDNISNGSAHIVDVRDVRTGAPLPFSEANFKYIMKVDAMNAILDDRYFIRAVHQCEAKLNASKPKTQGPHKKVISLWRIALIRVMCVVRLREKWG